MTPPVVLTGRVPRIALATLPTPLQETPRLREALGGVRRCPRILVKRDDLTGLVTGGNKIRKMEYSVAQALVDRGTVLVTTGSVQSNHARAVAAAARCVGLPAVLILTASGPVGTPAGNHLLDVLLGAEVIFVPPGPDPTADNPYELECLEATMHRLRVAGGTPVLIPLGASDAIGTAAYVAAAEELDAQLRTRHITASRVYVGAGSRGTQAGLVLGRRLLGASWAVHGIAVSPGDPAKTARAVAFTNACADRLGQSVRVTAADFITHQEYFGEGYAIPTTACQEALQLVARTEALILDPVYTGKVMAGLIDHIRRGIVAADETVVLAHTGGTASIFAQYDQLGLVASCA